MKCFNCGTDLKSSEVPAGFCKPFYLGPMGIYIFDANDRMAAQFVDDEHLAPRGYGPIQYRSNPDKDWNSWSWYVKGRTQNWTSKQHAVDMLNAPPPTTKPIQPGEMDLPELDNDEECGWPQGLHAVD